MLLSLLLIPIVAYAVAVGALYMRQEALLFFPEPLARDHHFPHAGVEERYIEVDGAVLHALHFRQPNARGLIFFLHGNAGHNGEWLPDTDFYERTGYDVFLLDYRGFGKSTGRITSEAQLHADVETAWNAVAPEYKGRRIVITGRSLGSGPAAFLATKVDSDLLVLVSPYSSVREAAAELYPWIPMNLLRYPLPTREWLPQVRMPVRLIHGEDDATIPIVHAERLMRFRPDAELLRLPGIGHADVHGAPLYTQRLVERLAAIDAARPAIAAS
jgi:pimeloyl-ACP methyl ester carboxylesterase